MKFNCGLTKKDKWALHQEKYGVWRQWFAWYPIRLGSRDCRWLEKVERRHLYYTWGQPYMNDRYEYAPLGTYTWS